jgi:hypothetical protein
MEKTTDRELALRAFCGWATVADSDLTGAWQVQHVELTGLESIGAGIGARIEG